MYFTYLSLIGEIETNLQLIPPNPLYHTEPNSSKPSDTYSNGITQTTINVKNMHNEDCNFFSNSKTARLLKYCV